MNLDLMKSFAQIAAPAGIAIGAYFYIARDVVAKNIFPKEGANKRGNSSRLTQSFHFFMFEPIFSPVNALNQPI